MSKRPFRTFKINVHHKAVRPLSDAEFDRLKADIKVNGIQQPVLVTEDGTVIDGHHRVRAAKELRIPLANVPWELVKGDVDHKAVAVSLNTARRQMSDEELQAIVDSSLEAGESIRDIAKKTGASKSKVGRAAAKSTAKKTATVKGQKRNTAKRAAAKAPAKRDAAKALFASWKKLSAADQARFANMILAHTSAAAAKAA